MTIFYNRCFNQVTRKGFKAKRQIINTLYQPKHKNKYYIPVINLQFLFAHIGRNSSGNLNMKTKFNHSSKRRSLLKLIDLLPERPLTKLVTPNHNPIPIPYIIILSNVHRNTNSV